MRVRNISLMAAAVVIGMLPVACVDDDDGTAEESVDTTVTEEASPASTSPEATPTTSVATAATSSTTAPSVAAGAESTRAWHAPGSAHSGPGDAVAEFAEFVGFGQGFLLGEFLQGDSRSGEIEIRPVEAESLDSPPETFSDWPDLIPWAPTTAFVRLGADDHWTVIGAASDGIVVDQPNPEATVSSRLDVKLTNNLASGVWMQVWPDGSAEMLWEKDLVPGGGIMSPDAVKWRLEVPPGAAGPATAIFQSRSEVSGATGAVTTVRIELTG